MARKSVKWIRLTQRGYRGGSRAKIEDPNRLFSTSGTPKKSIKALCKPRRCSLEGLHQRLHREWLCEIGEAPGLKRSRANSGVVVSRHVDDRHGNVRCFETVPQLDT